MSDVCSAHQGECPYDCHIGGDRKLLQDRVAFLEKNVGELDALVTALGADETDLCVKELKAIIDNGRRANNDERLARDWLARKKLGLEEAMRKAEGLARAAVVLAKNGTESHQVALDIQATLADALDVIGHRDTKPDNVVQLRKGVAVPEPLTDQKSKPYLVLDQATGLYDLVLDSVVVYANLDPVSMREQVRKNADAYHVQPGDKVLYNGKVHTVQTFTRGAASSTTQAPRKIEHPHPIANAYALHAAVGNAMESSGAAIQKLHEVAKDRMVRDLNAISPLPPDVLTKEMIQKAYAALEAAKIPPAECECCGHPFYFLARAGWASPPEHFLCADCEKKR